MSPHTHQYPEVNQKYRPLMWRWQYWQPLVPSKNPSTTIHCHKYVSFQGLQRLSSFKVSHTTSLKRPDQGTHSFLICHWLQLSLLSILRKHIKGSTLAGVLGLKWTPAIRPKGWYRSISGTFSSGQRKPTSGQALISSSNKHASHWKGVSKCSRS